MQPAFSPNENPCKSFNLAASEEAKSSVYVNLEERTSKNKSEYENEVTEISNKQNPIYQNITKDVNAFNKDQVYENF